MWNRRLYPLRSAICCALLVTGAHSVAAAEADRPNADVVATFKGEPITEEDLQKAAAADLEKLELSRLQAEAGYKRNQHQILEADLSRLLEERVLDAEAAKRGISREDLLKTELEGKVKEVTQQAVNTFYEQNKQRISKPLEQVKPQIEQYLKNENYNRAKEELVDRLKMEYGVTVKLEPYRVKVETAGSPSRGSETAPVTIVEFSDFQCPYCARLHTTLRDLLAKYGDEVRLVYKQFPLPQLHPDAEMAAEASLCAADQGQFWEMHDLMFQTQNQLKEDDLINEAAKLHLDPVAFNKCLSSGQHAEQIKRDEYEGSTLGVAGTPALFINGRFLSGAVPIEDIARIINEETQKSSHQPTTREAGIATKHGD